MAITTTAQTLVKDAMKLIGALAQGEEPTAGEFEDGFNRLNELVDYWATQRLTQQTILRTVVDIVADQVSYTVGSGGDVDIARPEYVDDVRLLYTTSDPENEQGLVRLTDQDWQRVALKAMTNTQPTAWYYRNTMPTGTLYLWPIPDNSTNDFVVYTPTALTQFAAQSTSYTLAPAYARALRINLAVTLAPEFGRTLDPLILLQANEALGSLKRLNVPMVDLDLDPALTPSRGVWWNILTGP